MKATLRNDFHNTSATVIVKNGKISELAMIRAQKKLCSGDCTCGGVRGDQDFYIENLFNGFYLITAKAELQARQHKTFMNLKRSLILVQMGGDKRIPTNATGYITDLAVGNALGNATPAFIADRLDMLSRYVPDLVAEYKAAE